MALAVGMQGAGQHFLAGAGFALNEHGDAAFHQAQGAAEDLAHLWVAVVGNIGFGQWRAGQCGRSGTCSVFANGRHRRHLLLFYSS